MRYRIHQIRLNIGEGHEALEQAVCRKLRRKNLGITDIKIVKESVDARKKPEIKLVYTLDFSCHHKLPLEQVTEETYEPVSSEQKQRLSRLSRRPGTVSRPVVVGFGPCGIFAALTLAEAGLSPIVLERGADVDSRVKAVERFWAEGVLDPESNVQFGEGGAGTFSDGKLTTGIRDVRIRKVLREFADAGAGPEILYRQKPHIGTDKLRGVVKNLRQKIEALGGEIRFQTKLQDITTRAGAQGQQLESIHVTAAAGSCEAWRTDRLLLAVGHSARDTFAMLLDSGIWMEQKPFSIGVRIEHPQEMIDAVQYGDASLAESLGHADYKLSYRCENGRGVYTFCMCPGGQVIDASSEPGMAVTNGMSFSRRNGKYANSGLLVDVRKEDMPSRHPLAGVEFQRKYERLAYRQGGGTLPVTSYGAFRRDVEDPVRNSLPVFAAEAIVEAMPHLGRKLKGFDRDDAAFTAVETRSSSPVRIRRDHRLQSSIGGIYPAGEGAGYAGGIMSAAVDGIKSAERIISDILQEQD